MTQPFIGYNDDGGKELRAIDPDYLAGEDEFLDRLTRAEELRYLASKLKEEEDH
jgi:hypothetical protein